MTPPDAPADPDVAWVIAGVGTDLLVGPSRALTASHQVRVRVAIATPVPPEDLGTPVAHITVSESGVRSFVVPWHETPDGRTVALNPAGGNQVSWNAAATDVGVTAVADAHLTDVRVRFVLRHFTTVLLEGDLGGRSVHAVTAALGGGDPRVLAVAGPTRSGKTRLLNQLLVSGVLERTVDDDCPILLDGGLVATLVPRRYEVERARSSSLALLVLLSDAVGEARQVDPEYARAFLDRTPMPWPAPWLPAPQRPGIPALPHDLAVLEVPAQDPDAYRDVLSAATRLISR